MTIAFQVTTQADGKYICRVARTTTESEDPRDGAAAMIAEKALCIVFECLGRDEQGDPFLFEQKLARRLGEEFAGEATP